MKSLSEQRRDVAEDVCAAILILMECDALSVPAEMKAILAQPMEEWAELAEATGTLYPGQPS